MSNMVFFSFFFSFYQVRDCLEDDQGITYRGMINKTKSGITCQDWSAKTPHDHSYDVIFNNSKNYCRNSGLNLSKPWCYTLDTSVKWDYCDISLCGRYKIEGKFHLYTLRQKLSSTLFIS